MAMPGKTFPFRVRAFTLLEMMMAVVLIGITAMLVVVNAERDEGDIARLEARRFAALVKHLQDESILAGYPLALGMDAFDNRYQFYTLDGTWKAVQADHTLRPREVPEFIAVELKLLQSSDSGKNEEDEDEEEDVFAEDEAKSKPSGPDPANMIVVEPSGLTSPFIATFAAGEERVTVALDAQQNVVVGKPTDKSSG